MEGDWPNPLNPTVFRRPCYEAVRAELSDAGTGPGRHGLAGGFRCSVPVTLVGGGQLRGWQGGPLRLLAAAACSVAWVVR